MRKRQFLVLIERDEDGVLVGSCPALRGCHSQARDLSTLLKRLKEAIQLCLEVEHPTTVPLEFVGLQEVEIG